MGEIRDYVCSCGYQKRIFIGAGLNGCNTDAIKRFFPKEIEAFLREKQAGMVQSYLLSNAVIACTYCKEIETVPCFSYQTYKGTVTHLKEMCSVCGKQVDQQTDEENIKCPKCGLRMNYNSVGNWD